MLITFHYDDWVMGRLRLYLLELSPGVFLFPKRYSRHTKGKFIEFLESNANKISGFIYVDTPGYNSIRINGQLTRRGISTIDGITVTAKIRKNTTCSG